VEKNEDRRVRKTKKALRQALIELLNEKSIQNITVRELTDRADVHRSTFYANFCDVYALYAHTEECAVREIGEIASGDASLFFGGLIDYVNANRQTARLFFGNIDFSRRITDLLRDSCIACWCEEYGNEAAFATATPEETDYYIQFYISGAIGAVAKWVSEDFKYPAEKLAEHLADIEHRVRMSAATHSLEAGSRFPDAPSAHGHRGTHVGGDAFPRSREQFP